MNLRARAVYVLALFAFCSSAMGQWHPVYFNDFNQHKSDRTYTLGDLAAEWNNPPWDNGVEEGRVEIETGFQAFGNDYACLALKSPAGSYAPRRSGAQWKLFFDETYDEAFLTYQVKFKEGFDFVRGGKLPGLAGGTAPTGTTAATGYNGWTARMMWRTDFRGNPGSPEQTTSNATSYAKYVGSGFDGDGKDEDTTDFTNSDNSRVTLESDQWYHVGQYIRMNDPGVKNGAIQIWLGDQLVVNQQNVEFRKTRDFGIDQVYFSSFFGGGSSWRTSKSETIYLDNVMVWAND